MLLARELVLVLEIVAVKPTTVVALALVSLFSAHVAEVLLLLLSVIPMVVWSSIAQHSD